MWAGLSYLTNYLTISRPAVKLRSVKLSSRMNFLFMETVEEASVKLLVMETIPENKHLISFDKSNESARLVQHLSMSLS